MKDAPAPDFTEEEIDLLLAQVDSLSPAEVDELNRLVDELATRKKRQAAYDDLIAFCLYMDPNYKVGRHHRILADKLMAIERGADAEDGEDRICVNIPPRHGKSQLVSIYFPAWFLGRNPGKKVMMVSHTTDLAVDFGRKVRNLIDTEAYKDIFPAVTLATDSKSAGRWNTNFGGEYFACGIGSSIAGRGADLLLVDDPHSEQDVLNGNFEVFEKAYQWFAFGARTRLMPGGRVAIIQCMTGDTPVLRPDGSETPLRDIRVGDEVMSYKKGALVSRKVLNWQLSGLDKVFTIKTTCGKIVQANERHPFLVWTPEGTTIWVRLRDLKPGDSLVLLTGARISGGQKQSPASATPAAPAPATTESTRTQSPDLLAFGANIAGRSVKRLDAVTAPEAKAQTGIVESVTGSTTGPTLVRRGRVQNKTETATSSTATASLWTNTIAFLRSKTAAALSVVSRLTRPTPALTGAENSVWTIATTPVGSEHSCATTVTSRLDTPKHLRSPEPWPNTSTFTPTVIESITPAGVEDVFDIEVEETENFIANSIVSSNTRWHMDDLTGRVVRDMTQNEGSDQYEVVEFPAILDIENPETGEYIQKALWPEFFDLPALLRTKASMPVFQWNAQYQQNPTGEESSIIKREWWRVWPSETPPHVEYIIMALDAAAEANNRADFTSLTTWGVFYNEEERENHIILLNAVKARMEFPELKAMALAEYREWEPDAFIVEKKSSGTALYQEMRRSGLMVQEYTPVRGSVNNPNTKMARLNSVSDIIASGLVWIPPTRWAEDLVEEVAGFPFASNDDQVDTTIMALMRFRQGGFIRLPTDEPDEDIPYRHKVEYY